MIFNWILLFMQAFELALCVSNIKYQLLLKLGTGSSNVSPLLSAQEVTFMLLKEETHIIVCF